jgi:hypothetical protein
VLYGGNTFLVTVPFDKHNHDTDQTGYAAKWLWTIGYCSNLLRNVYIDIDPKCECSSNFYGNSLNLLPLVRYIWAKPDSQCEIAFVNAKGRLDSRFCDPNRKTHNAKRLNNILYFLSKPDLLGIRRYSKFERLLNEIRIAPRQEWGTVIYGESNGIDAAARLFLINDTGKELHWRNSENWYPNYLRKKIEIYRFKFAEPIIFDLDQKTASGLDTNLLQVNRRLRARTMLCFTDFNQVTVRMTTTEQETSFSNFQSLREWLCSTVSQIYPEEGYRTSNEFNCPEIVFKFELVAGSSLSELQINILEFLRLTERLDHTSVVRFSLAYYQNHGIKAYKECTLSLSALRQNFFPFLVQVSLAQPNTMKRTRPEIWINGEGSIIKVVYHGRDRMVINTFLDKGLKPDPKEFKWSRE